MIPERLRDLLQGSAHHASVLALVDATSTILADNKTPFFPDYTDHGPAHIRSVLEAAVRLVPDAVWDDGELLTPADAAVLVCATLLHDLALHVRKPGFVALVADDTRFKPVPWFAQPHGARPGDVAWPQLWQAFRKEARHFTQSQLDRILGPDGDGVPAIAFGDADVRPNRWTDADLLLVGEFLRRHHARLAHEIALHGFPGLAASDYPLLKQLAPTLADPVGVTARSHNEDLRTMLEYLEHVDPGAYRSGGALLPYLMSLLRIADYLQLDASRAPTVLLNMREPQSPQSVAEWNKHETVSSVEWQHRDPAAVYVRVEAGHGLRTHLQLRELVGDVQRELDTTTAVLSEVYALPELSALRLSRQRVRTNLDEANLHAQLPYVPRRATLRSADDLFRLVISDLYGNAPVIAGRELLQNAADAVRERRRWEERSGRQLPADAFREQDEDVLLELREEDDGSLTFVVSDRGIGMTPETVVDQLLVAGASWSMRPDDLEVDTATAIRWMKAGRFGVGAFAAFLLGPEVHVRTRHVEAERGLRFAARLDGDVIELTWDDEAPLGTQVEIPCSRATVEAGMPDGYWEWPQPASFLEAVANFYGLGDPQVVLQARMRAAAVEVAHPRGPIPLPGGRLPDAWRAVPIRELDAVLWRIRTLGEPRPDGAALEAARATLAHNGIYISDPGEPRRTAYQWRDAQIAKLVQRPDLAVFDSRHRLGVSLNRYQLTESTLPFEPELLRSIGEDLVAFALTAGARQHPLGLGAGLSPIVTREGWFPLASPLTDVLLDDELLVLWRADEHDAAQARAFLGGALPSMRWDRGAFRSVLRIVSTGRETDANVRFTEQWQISDGNLRQAVRGTAQRLGGPEHTSVLLRCGVAPSYGELHSSADNPRKVSLPGDLHAVVWESESSAPGTVERLLAVGRELAVLEPERTTGLTSFAAPGRRPALAEDDLHPLAASWMDLIGAPLERDEQARVQRAEAIAAQHPQMRALMRKWERLLGDFVRPGDEGDDEDFSEELLSS